VTFENRSPRETGGFHGDDLAGELIVPTNGTIPDSAQEQTAPRLRPYQSDVISRVNAEIAAGRRRVLLVAPTGSGKTVIAAAFIAAALGGGIV
jgi:superfamily II DNA or RNA helicase